MENENLTVEQVAAILHISTQTVCIRCKKRQLPAFKLPGSRRWLISKRDLEKLLREQKKI